MAIEEATSPSRYKYHQVASELRREILRGNLRPGDRLPSFSEGKAQGISQRTFEQAHGLLEREGLITRRPRRGMFVAAPHQARPSGQTQRRSTVMNHTVAVIADQPGVEKLNRHNDAWAHISGVGVLEQLAEGGHNSLVLSAATLQERELMHLREDPPVGLLVLDMDLEGEALRGLVAAIRSTGAPFVLSGDADGMHDCDRVVSDHELGAYGLTSWLIKSGRRRILNLWPGRTDRYWFAAKWAGYRRAMEEAGLPCLDPVSIPERETQILSREWFDDEVRRILGYLAPFLMGENRVDAIMAHTDKMVPAAAAAVRLVGLRPNEDIALVGYDNYWTEDPWQEWEPTAPLATVDKQSHVLGTESVNLLRSLIASGSPGEPQRRLVPPKLIITNTVPE